MNDDQWIGPGLGGTFGDQEGDYPMPTNPQTPGAFGNPFNQLTQFLNNSNLAQAIPLLGLSALTRNSSFFNPPAAKVGYQGGIPMYTASREQTPYVSGAENEARRLKQATLDALSTGANLDQVAGAAQRTYGISPGQIDAAMRTEGQYRRPGLGGITYFTPMQYTGTGKDIAALKAGETVGGGPVTPTPGVTSGTTAVSPTTPVTGGISTLPAAQPTTPKQTYSPYQTAQAIYDVLNPGGGITGTLAQARQGALNRGVSAQQFDAALMPRLSQAIREARAQMPSATDAQIRDAAARRYGIDAATFDKAASLAAPTNAQIKSQIAANIDKPQEVAWLANTYGLDTKELSDITGFTDNQVRSYFADNDVPLPSANQAMDKFTDEQVAQAIQESMKQGFSLAQSKQGAEEKYGISKEQLDRVTSVGRSVGDVVERRTALSAPKQTANDLRQLESTTPTPRNYQEVGDVGGIPLLTGTGPAESSYVWMGGAPITSRQDLEVAGKKLGLSQDELLQATRLISEKSKTPYIGADLYSPIFNAIRESLNSGYTMDQIYEGAQKNFGLTRSDVDAAMRYNNVDPQRPSVMTEEEFMRLSREGLPPRGAAAGGVMPGGIAMLARGRYLKGNGDGVSDSIPARFAGSGQEARLADGEFVVPARVVSELGNGSSDAGARKLYAMLDRVEARAKKAKRGKPSGADRELNKLA